VGRRVSLPAADDLFRRTADEAAPRGRTQLPPEAPAESPPEDEGATGDRQPSGRVRHDEKMTVYITADELLEIERARLTLRSRHGLAVDRGRLVREAVAMALSDLDTEGEDSLLVQRLTDR
jgi:hypothetical protein